MAILDRALVLLVAAATAACSVLVGDDEMSSRYGEEPAPIAAPSKPGKVDAGPAAGDDAGAVLAPTTAPTRIFAGSAPVAEYPVVTGGGRIYFGFVAPGQAPGRISSVLPSGGDLRSHYKGDFRPVHLELDELYVYAAVQRDDSTKIASVRRIAKQTECAPGSASCELDAIGVLGAGVVTRTGGEVLWSQDRTIRVVEGTSKRTLPPGASAVKQMRTDASGTVFVLENGVGATGGVRRYTPGTNALTPFVTIASPVDMLLIGTEVYVLTVDGKVRAYPKQGGEARLVADGVEGARHLATDGTKIFMSRVSPSGSMSIDVVGIAGNAPPTTLAVASTEPNSIAVDDTSVYWTDGSGSVWRAGK